MHKSTCLTRTSGVLTAALLVTALSTPLAADDEWLVYIGGGLEPIRGAWSERQGRVIFTKEGGTLTSVPLDEVDLPASAIITWQLGGRRRVPPRAELEDSGPPAEDAPPPPCIEARLVRFFDGESLEVRIGAEREIIHVACLDTPESRHRYEALGWFGRVTTSAVEAKVPQGAELCLTETSPLQRDDSGHRIVRVALADGSDYATTVIADGFGMLRPTECRNGAHYRAAEDYAIGAQRGLWGRASADAAFTAARLNGTGIAGPSLRGSRSGGNRSRGGG